MKCNPVRLTLGTALPLSLAVLLCSCTISITAPNSSQPTTPAQSAPVQTAPAATEVPIVPTETPSAESPSNKLQAASTSAPGATDNYCAFIPVGQSCTYDLDGDGTPEEICYSVTEEDYLYHASLTINGTDYSVDVDMPSRYYCVLNVNASDNTLQLGLQDYGPSADYSTTICSYDSQGVHKLGVIEGVFDQEMGYTSTVCQGDGTITTYLRLNILQTWFAPLTWSMDSSDLTPVTPDLYEPLDLFDGLGIDLTTTKELSLYTQMDRSSEQIILPAGASVHLTATDNQNWISMTADGADGTLWLYLDENSRVQTSNGAEDSFNCFENLSMAD